MKYIFGFLFSLFTICSLVQAISKNSPFNISEYVALLPSDLRNSAATALKAEAQVNDGIPWTKPSCESTELIISCPPNKYRKTTGECNNIRHSKWGSRGAPFSRLVKPTYSDGISQPRLSVKKHPLPSPLDVADSLKINPVVPHDSVTALVGAWSELILHDLASIGNLRNQECCKSKNVHPECYGWVGNGQCMEYMRSLPAMDMDNCQFEYRNQMNLATSFLDGSAVYGSTEEASHRLRTYDAGLVNVSACASCRTNAIYSAILKEHNRIALALSKLNKHWNDQTLFLESKKIVASEIQHITYNEFLPTILGEEAISRSGLHLKSEGYFTGYSSANKAAIYNEVALTALPTLLSMLPTSLMNETADSFSEMIDLLLRTPSQNPTMNMIVPLRNDWDTASLLIHMGRDHGLPPYTKISEFCFNVTISQFSEFAQLRISENNIKLLNSLYKSPHDVDLLTGAILEDPRLGALVGPTFTCLLQHQFSLLRNSDRFWYENDLPPSSLTKQQLKEIRKVTISGLLCANTEGLNNIQPRSFVLEDPFLNARISCDQHPFINFSHWIEMDPMTDLSEDILMMAINKAEQEILQRRKMEYEVWSTVGGVDPKSPTGTAASFSKANKAALRLANSSLLLEFASNEIINSLVSRRKKRQIFDNNIFSAVLRDEISEGLQNIDVSTILTQNLFEVEEGCEDNSPCDPSSPFRTISGHCNNLRNPSYGKSLTTFARLLPSQYEDGISAPRIRGATGAPLPSPRVVSMVIHPDISNLHSRYNLMTMQFAQFLDHDLTMTPIHKGFHESIPDCRSCDSSRTVHPECNPIPIPSGDVFYPEINITSGHRMCFPFMRSLPGQKSLGPREQVNQNTAFVDASQVYGENNCVLQKLKGFGPKMNSTKFGRSKDLLPQTDHHPECKSSSGLCFIAGDERASEQPGLTAIHTLFMREHNLLSEGLQKVNPHWDEHKIFEHARKILIAEWQHITYNEFLPRVLGWNAVNLYGLKLLPQGYYKEYNPSCNPSIFTEFGAAAFRIGHSLLRPHLPRLDSNYQIVDPPILLRDGFFRTDIMLRPGMIDELTRGLISTPMETLDQFITGEVTNHLFEDKKIPFSGIDLIALNIQRGRDHGIPSYNNYRALCNLKRATVFEDLAREIPIEVIERLKKIYATVDDIDIFPGGMSERPLQGGLVGPTFACIIAIQFRQLRKCDRFWYENEDPTVRFTEAQLAQIRGITLSKILCQNMDGVPDIQRAAFELPSQFLNPRQDCRNLPGIDLNAWRESPSGGCVIGDRHISIGQSAFPSPCTSCVCTHEGGQCASLRVTDCNQLMREWPREAVLKDDICAAQCGNLLRSNRLARPHLNTNLTPPPPAGGGRNRGFGRTRVSSFAASGSFSGFEFPDLTDFIVS